MIDFLGGTITMGYAIAGLFFLRFWTTTRDSLLGVFALAFFLMALIRPLALLGHFPSEHYHYVYVIRLVAYVLIIGAIVLKNRTE